MNKPPTLSNRTASELGLERMPFGKYRRKTLHEIYEEDRRYMEYMADSFWEEIKDIHGEYMTMQQRFKARFIAFWQKIQEMEENYNG